MGKVRENMCFDVVFLHESMLVISCAFSTPFPPYIVDLLSWSTVVLHI